MEIFRNGEWDWSLPFRSVTDLRTPRFGMPSCASRPSRMFTNSIRPLVEMTGGATITVQVGTRNRLNENTNFTLAKALNQINGEANVRVNSRYQRYRLQIADGFIHGNGVKASQRISGGRR